MSTARDFAFRLLRRWLVQHDPPIIPDRADASWATLPPRQRAAAFDLLTGVLRWRNALDAVIASRLRQPIESLDPPVRAILWLGAYQLLFQEQTADYAAVDTAVALAKRSTPKAAGLVNAVLRGITRLLPRRGPSNPSSSSIESLSRRALALDFTTRLFFNADLFPDPATSMTAHLAAVRSHPALLVKHLQRIHGDAVTADLLLRNNQRPLITLRTDAAAMDLPAVAGLVAHGTADRFLVASQGWNGALEMLVRKGVLSPQDPTSALPVRQFQALVQTGRISAPRRILDLCAGLGTKTIQLARAFPDAIITAADVDSAKLKRLASRARQTGQKNITVLPLGPGDLQSFQPGDRFDLVLADVPCSNTGVLAKRVQSRWRWPTLDFSAIAALQNKLLDQAAALLAPAGVLLYSTCSIDPEENHSRVAGFLSRHAGFQLLAEQATLPSIAMPAASSHDGGYFAILVPVAQGSQRDEP